MEKELLKCKLKYNQYLNNLIKGEKLIAECNNDKELKELLVKHRVCTNKLSKLIRRYELITGKEMTEQEKFGGFVLKNSCLISQYAI